MIVYSHIKLITTKFQTEVWNAIKQFLYAKLQCFRVDPTIFSVYAKNDSLKSSVLNFLMQRMSTE